jgi:hypothetical protein
MIPVIDFLKRAFLAYLVSAAFYAAAGADLPQAPPEVAGCLPTGDGYFRARVGGAIEANVDWPNSGTRCDGESKTKPAGVRMSFRRSVGTPPDLLFVFGLSGVKEGQPAHGAGANLTVILQGSSRIYGTLGDSRCAIDSLSQRRLPDNPGADGKGPRSYRVEARGYCTQPARAVRGDGAVLVSTFDFAGVVVYDGEATFK